MKTFLVAILFFPAFAFAGGESLVLETERDVFRADETITVVFRLEGVIINPALKDTPGFIPPMTNALFASMGSNPELTCRMRLKFETAGEHVLGPYSLKFGGKVLQSNRKIIKIISSESSSPQVFFDHAEVSVGSKFSLIILTKGDKIDGIKWRQNSMVREGEASTSTSTSTVAGNLHGKHGGIFRLFQCLLMSIAILMG
jgi:hypothetical protein